MCWSAVRCRAFEIREPVPAAARTAVEAAVARLGGVSGVWLRPGQRRLVVRGEVSETDLVTVLATLGYTVAAAGPSREADPRTGRSALAAAFAGAVLLIIDTYAQALGAGPAWRAGGVAVVVLVMVRILPAALARGTPRERPRCVPAVGLVCGGVAAGIGHALLVLAAPALLVPEGQGGYLAFPLFALAVYQAGVALMGRGAGPVARPADSLRALLPATAAEHTARGWRRVPSSRLTEGARVHVDDGERVPADGRIETGRASLDESAFTGTEGVVSREPGDRVLAGTLCRDGGFTMVVTRPPGEGELAGMIAGVHRPGGPSRRPCHGLDRLLGWLLTGALTAAVLSLAGWWLLDGTPGQALLSACVLLVLAASPAVPLAVPLALNAGLIRLVEFGVIARQPDVLDALAGLSVIALDKTGTLTAAAAEVVAVEPVDGVAIRDIFRWAAAVEAGERPGPVSRAAEERSIRAGVAEDVERLPGGALRGRIDGRDVVVGTHRALAAARIDNPLSKRGLELLDEGSTPLFVAADGVLAGALALAAPLRPEARDSVTRLRRLGLRVVMLTGDEPRAARAVADSAAIGEVRAGVRAEDKARHIRYLQQSGERVGMVGDGVNDTLALAGADVGIAVARGSEVAVDSADVTLVRDSLHAVADAVLVGRLTVRNMREGAFGALVYALALAPVAAGLAWPVFGWLVTPGVLAVLVVLSVLTVLANAARLRYQEVAGGGPE
ncbi:HAD-IC family P-type ATPase [Arhodomonas aquaeolei]|uniref:heavy metal translocating P-type ATPase n=1 Tax=Arhodomonas aquaeolei TaxID=2369 RepID=UPI00216767A3|nr:HAD-IC family P-type ATPase [Arhodomonas aquaeolei]MCS4504898.1 HAD-IC family P-type ATPase [Arhodomonas aquaeolei]